MMPPRLSIIVTAHNCATWLQDTLDSIVASAGNTLSSCEIILVNDASEDDTQAIIERFAAVYPQTRHQQTWLRNIGQVRNHAVAQARGDYILMVDGDDKVLPGAIADHLPQLEAQRPDIYLSKIIEKRSADMNPVPPWHAGTPVVLARDEAITRFLIHRDFQAHFIGQYFRRHLLQENPFPSFICYEDAWLFPLLLTKSEKILYSTCGFYLYRKHAASLSTTMQPEKIVCLLAATQHMDEVLPTRFQALITCHWLDIVNRHSTELKKLGVWEQVKKRIHQQSLWAFLLNGKIRVSYKRKMLKLRRLN